MYTEVTHVIEDGLCGNRWHPFRVGKRGPIVFHFLFADDIICYLERRVWIKLDAYWSVLMCFVQVWLEAELPENTNLLY